MWVAWCIPSNDVQWCFCCVEGGCDKSSMEWSEVSECGGVLGRGDECDPCESPLELALFIPVRVSTVEDGVSIYHESGGSVEVSLCKDHAVDVVVLHVSNDGVDLCRFLEACDIPASQPGEALAGDFGGLLVPVMVWDF